VTAQGALAAFGPSAPFARCRTIRPPQDVVKFAGATLLHTFAILLHTFRPLPNIERRPPVARVEVISVRPGPSYVWVAGYWGWVGADYYWVPGRWTVPPQRVYTVWVSGSWDHHRGRGWHYRPGHWRKR
jgi:hypothetical protein